MATIKANKDKARFISNTISQDALDTDWVDHEVITKYKLPEITLEAETSSTWVDGSNEKLVTPDVVAENDKVKLYDGSNVVDGSLGAVTTSGLVSSTDPFGDGSLVHKYELNGNITATIGTSGTIAVGVTYDGTNKFGTNSAKFGSATTDRIGLNHTYYNPQMSISGWVKIGTISSWVSFFWSKRGGNNDAYKGFSMGLKSDGSWYSDFDSDSAVYSLNGTDTITPNTWTHVVQIIDTASQKVQVYIDKVLIFDSTTSGENFDWDNTDNVNTRGYWVLGNSNTTGDQGLNGYIDQVEFYNKALSASEVNTLYTQTVTKYSADITSFGLSTPPTKAFFNKTIDTTLSAEATGKCKSSTVTQIGVL
jgi:hypothetical protein